MGTLKHLKHLKPVMVKLSRLHTCHAVPSFNVQVKAQRRWKLHYVPWRMGCLLPKRNKDRFNSLSNVKRHKARPPGKE